MALVTIDGKEYNEEDLNERQKYLVTQIQDVNRKIGDLRFNIDQLNFTKDAISAELVITLRENEETSNDKEWGRNDETYRKNFCGIEKLFEY